MPFFIWERAKALPQRVGTAIAVAGPFAIAGFMLLGTVHISWMTPYLLMLLRIAAISVFVLGLSLSPISLLANKFTKTLGSVPPIPAVTAATV